MLVNNAGTASVAPLLNADVEKMDDMIALNTTALTRLTYAAAPAFVARGAGTIINIPSVVGISPETLNGVYGATKPLSLRSAIRCSTSSLTKAFASSRCCRARPRPTSGKSLASHGRGCPRQSSCRRKTWSMQRWSGSTKANWLRFPVSRMAANGPVSRPRAAPSPSDSGIPFRRADTGLAHPLTSMGEEALGYLGASGIQRSTMGREIGDNDDFKTRILGERLRNGPRCGGRSADPRR
jgi:hypothetical protein